MIVSTTAILFRGDENLNELHLENPTDHLLIFKLKITHTDLFTIAPGKGLCHSRQKVLVSVKLNRQVDVNAKLLVSYAQVEGPRTQEPASIDQQWSRIDKQRHQNIIIPISRTASKQPEGKREEKTNFKKTDSPLLDSQAHYQQEKQEAGDNNSKRIEPLKKSLNLKQTTSIFRTVEDLDKREITQSKVHSQKLEKELEAEREKNRKLADRLIEREKKIMYLTNQRQMEINRSLNRADEEGSEWSCCNTLLAAFLLLMLGFFLSKYELPLGLSL